MPVPGHSRCSTCKAEHIKASVKKYQQSARGKASVTAALKRYSSSDKGKRAIQETNKRWVLAHPEHHKDIRRICSRRGDHIRREREKVTKQRLTEAQWQDALKHFNGKCAYCGAAGDLQQEHFQPLAHGGDYSAKNIIPACPHCNRSKWHADPLEWCFSTGRMVQYALAADYLGLLQ